MKKLILILIGLCSALVVAQSQPMMLVWPGEKITFQTDLPATTNIWDIQVPCWFAEGKIEVIPDGIIYTVPGRGSLDYIGYDNNMGTRFEIPLYIIGSENSKEPIQIDKTDYSGAVPVIGDSIVVSLMQREGGKGPGGKTFRKTKSPQKPQLPTLPPDKIRINPGDPEWDPFNPPNADQFRPPRKGDIWTCTDPLGPSGSSNPPTVGPGGTYNDTTGGQLGIEVQKIKVSLGGQWTEGCIWLTYMIQKILFMEVWKYIPPWTWRATRKGTAWFNLILCYDKMGNLLKRSETQIDDWRWVTIRGEYP